MENMKIGSKLAIGFGLVLALVIALSLETRSILLGLQEDVSYVVNETMPKVRLANDIINIVDENAGTIRNLILADNENQIAKENADIASQRVRVVAKYDSLEKAMTSDEERKAYQEVLAARKDFVPFQEGMMKLVVNKDGAKARELLFGEYQQYQKRYMEAVGRLLVVEDSIAQAHGKAAETDVANGVLMIVMASLLMVLLGVVIAILITRSVVKPIRKCMEAAEHIAEGNMDIEIESNPADQSETGMLAK